MNAKAKYIDRFGKVVNTENDQVGTRADLIQDYVICKNDEIVIYDLDGEADDDIDPTFDYITGSFADPNYMLQKCRNDVNTIRAKYTRYQAETMYLDTLTAALNDMSVKFKGE